jgi:hypothetical protein
MVLGVYGLGSMLVVDDVRPPADDRDKQGRGPPEWASPLLGSGEHRRPPGSTCGVLILYRVLNRAKVLTLLLPLSLTSSAFSIGHKMLESKFWTFSDTFLRHQTSFYRSRNSTRAAWRISPITDLFLTQNPLLYRGCSDLAPALLIEVLTPHWGFADPRVSLLGRPADREQGRAGVDTLLGPEPSEGALPCASICASTWIGEC